MLNLFSHDSAFVSETNERSRKTSGDERPNGFATIRFIHLSSPFFFENKLCPEDTKGNLSILLGVLVFSHSKSKCVLYLHSQPCVG